MSECVPNNLPVFLEYSSHDHGVAKLNFTKAKNGIHLAG